MDLKWNLGQKKCELKITASRNVTPDFVMPFEKGIQNLELKKGEVYELFA